MLKPPQDATQRNLAPTQDSDSFDPKERYTVTKRCEAAFVTHQKGVDKATNAECNKSEKNECTGEVSDWVLCLSLSAVDQITHPTEDSGGIGYYECGQLW